MEIVQEHPLDVQNECQELLDAVEYHCSQCEAAYEDIEVLNSKIRAVYDSLVAKTKGNRDHVSVIKHWVAGYLVAGGIRQAVCFKKQMHQICGIDSTTVDETFAAIKERVEFLVGYPLDPCE